MKPLLEHYETRGERVLLEKEPRRCLLGRSLPCPRIVDITEDEKGSLRLATMAFG